MSEYYGVPIIRNSLQKIVVPKKCELKGSTVTCSDSGVKYIDPSQMQHWSGFYPNQVWLSKLEKFEKKRQRSVPVLKYTSGTPSAISRSNFFEDESSDPKNIELATQVHRFEEYQLTSWFAKASAS